MKMLRTLERKYIPNLRQKKGYRLTKSIILAVMFLPIIILHHSVNFIRYRLLNKISIKRKTKPDIKLKNIVDGWTNLAFKTPAVEEVAINRAKICASCPFAIPSTSMHAIVVDNKTTHIRGMKCDKCGCPLSAKVRAMDDRCPMGKW